MTVTYQHGKLSRTMADKLAAARTSRNWTLKRAAAEMGCSISTVWNLENAQRVPSVPLAGDIARAYQLSRDDTIELVSQAVRNAGRDRPGKRRAAAKAAAN